MVVETFGAWGPAATPVLDQISKAGASAKALNPDLVTKYLRQTLSFTLQRLNVRTLLKFISPSADDLDDPFPIPPPPPSESLDDLMPVPSSSGSPLPLISLPSSSPHTGVLLTPTPGTNVPVPSPADPALSVSSPVNALSSSSAAQFRALTLPTVAEEPGPDVPELSPAVSVQPAGTLPSCARDSFAVAAENPGPDVPAPQSADPGPSVGSPVVDHPTSTTVKSLYAPSFPAPVSAELSGPPCVSSSHGMPVLGLVNLGRKKVWHLSAPMSRLFREG